MGFFSRRREAIINGILTDMVRKGERDRDVPGIFLDAALRFGQDHGGVLYADMSDSITFNIKIDNRPFSVFVFRGRTGKGANFTLTDKSVAKQSALDALDGLAAEMLERSAVRQATVAPRHPSWATDPEKLKNFIDRVTESVIRIMPPSFLEHVMKSDDFAPVTMKPLALAESAGKDFEEQVDIAINYFEDRWFALSLEASGAFEEQDKDHWQRRPRKWR